MQSVYWKIKSGASEVFLHSTVGTNSSHINQDELQFGITKEVFGADSLVVLSYIKNQTICPKTFVANRIQIIKDHSDVAQWQNVPSKSNPADYGLRGLDGTCLAKVKMWYKGPKSLWEPESSWKRDHIIEEIDAADPETEKEVSFNRIEVKTDTLETLETRFSSWNKMGRVFALVLKFKTNLLRKFFQKRDKTELYQQIGTSEQFLSNAEIEIVKKKIIKMAQNRPFAEEISLLGLAKNKKVSKVKQNSKLYSLDPFIGEDQVLRVGGRLKNGSWNNSFTHPVLLPKNCTITELLIR